MKHQNDLSVCLVRHELDHGVNLMRCMQTVYHFRVDCFCGPPSLPAVGVLSKSR